MPNVNAVPGVATADVPISKLSVTITAQAANATASASITKLSATVVAAPCTATATITAPTVSTGGAFGGAVTAVAGNAVASIPAAYSIDADVVAVACAAVATVPAPQLQGPQFALIFAVPCTAVASVPPPTVDGTGAPAPVATQFRFVVEAAFGSVPSDFDYNWVTIHDTGAASPRYCRGWSYQRGRQNQLNRIDTGTGTLVLNNENGEWDPQNAGSPFYPYVRPMLPIRAYAIVNGVTYPMFQMYADGFPRKRIGPRYSEVSLTLVDGQEGLAMARIPPQKATLTVTQTGVHNDLVFTAKDPGPDGNNITVAFFETHFRPLRQQRVVITVTGTNIRVDYIDDGSVQVDEVLTALRADVATMLLVDVENAPSNNGSGDMHPFDETHLAGGDTVPFPQELGGARISRCADLADWPAALREISTGVDEHAALALSTTEDGKLLSHMQDVVSTCSENGLLFVDGDGKLIFLDRVDKLTAHSTPAAVLSDKTTVLPDYATLVLADSPRGYWRFEESSGNAVDSSGNGHTLTANGGIAYGTAGAFTKSVTLNGTTGYYNVADHADFDLGDVLTLEAWVSPRAYQSGVFQIIVDKGNGAYRLTIAPTGRFRLEKPGTGTLSTSTESVPLFGHHHIAATKDGPEVHLYLDGKDVTGTVTNQTLTNNAIQMGVGAQLDGGPAAKFFDGGLDEVAIYATALSHDDILARFKARSFYYVDAVPNQAKELIVNDAIATREGGEPQTAFDADSARLYRRRSQSFTSTLATDLDVLAAVQATVIELKDPLEWIQQISVMPADDMECWAAMLGIELGARLTVYETPPHVAVSNADYVVQGLSWQFSSGPAVSAKVTFNLWPADPISNWFILDDPVRGKLDAGNRLGR